MLHEELQKIVNEARKFASETHWTGTCLDYLEKVLEKPETAQLSPGRVYNMIMNKGTENITDPKLPGYEDMVRYEFFKNDLFGLEEPLHDLMRFFKAGARRTETGKRILILVGPVSSGKSTIASMLKAGLENDPTPIYAIKGCPIHEEPLHLIPTDQRARWEEVLGVKIEGDLCPMCRFNLLQGGNYLDEDKNVLWETYPVVQIRLSERARVGIGTFQPSDPKNQDISELIGRIDLSKITQYGETDPRAYSLDGELEIANRGLIEYIEILKCDIKFHYVLLSVAQEQVLKAPGFPQIYVDEVILSHTNQTEFDKFKSIKENEALHDRMYPIFVPYNLRVRDEEKISKKLIERSEFKNLHLAPYTLTVAAQFAVLTRLVPSQILPNLIKKMKYYNGESVADKDKDQVDITQLRLEGRKNGEGMSGISPRFVVNALNVILGEKEGGGVHQPAGYHPRPPLQLRAPHRLFGRREAALPQPSPRGEGQRPVRVQGDRQEGGQPGLPLRLRGPGAGPLRQLHEKRHRVLSEEEDPRRGNRRGAGAGREADALHRGDDRGFGKRQGGIPPGDLRLQERRAGPGARIHLQHLHPPAGGDRTEADRRPQERGFPHHRGQDPQGPQDHETAPGRHGGPAAERILPRLRGEPSSVRRRPAAKRGVSSARFRETARDAPGRPEKDRERGAKKGLPGGSTAGKKRGSPHGR